MILKAKHIMTRNVIYAKKDTPVFDAMRLLAENNITGIPVVEDDMTLVGILTEQNVLRLFLTYKQEKDRTANDFMTQSTIQIDEEKPLLDVCYCLRDNPIRRVPVTSDGKVVGIISRSDMLKCILELWDGDAVPAASVQNNTEK